MLTDKCTYCSYYAYWTKITNSIFYCFNHVYSMSHEQFFQNMLRILYMPIPYPFALNIKK